MIGSRKASHNEADVSANPGAVDIHRDFVLQWVSLFSLQDFSEKPLRCCILQMSL
jgi:hypothetical protein